MSISKQDCVFNHKHEFCLSTITKTKQSRWNYHRPGLYFARIYSSSVFQTFIIISLAKIKIKLDYDFVIIEQPYIKTTFIFVWIYSKVFIMKTCCHDTNTTQHNNFRENKIVSFTLNHQDYFAQSLKVAERLTTH